MTDAVPVDVRSICFRCRAKQAPTGNTRPYQDPRFLEPIDLGLHYVEYRCENGHIEWRHDPKKPREK